MRRSPLLLALLAIVALASTASLLAGLRHALRGREKQFDEAGPMSERERARAALSGMLTTIDPERYPENLRPQFGLPIDRRAYLASLPRLDPPLSQKGKRRSRRDALAGC